MRFTSLKRRQPPPVIIISLIDVLIVMLIFLMVTTTFKNQPSLKLALPESKQTSREEANESLVVTISKQPPHYYFGQRAITFDQLKSEMLLAATADPEATLSIRPDKDATIDLLFRVLEAAKEAGIKPRVGIQTKTPDELN
ncbi:MAG: biopolymer transporter ExbD [Verrucomicrobia bacterium]|nr:biopolymer transporter ExbD [Verrucomicrobiota bacterium]